MDDGYISDVEAGISNIRLGKRSDFSFYEVSDLEDLVLTAWRDETNNFLMLFIGHEDHTQQVVDRWEQSRRFSCQWIDYLLETDIATILEAELVKD